MSLSWNHAGGGQAGTMGIEYLDGLYSYALVLTRNHAEAEDLVQETYVRAMQAMERLRAGSNIKGWLFTILKNIWLNQLRKRRNGPQMIEIEVGDGVLAFRPSRHLERRIPLFVGHRHRRAGDGAPRRIADIDGHHRHWAGHHQQAGARAGFHRGPPGHCNPKPRKGLSCPSYQ